MSSVIHVVLVGLGVVGVADVAAHRHAEQLAAKMVFEPGANDLLAVVEVLGADEADDGVDEKRLERARHRIGPRFAGLLIDAVVRPGRQRATLSGLEIHDVVAERAALQATAPPARLLAAIEVTPKERFAASVPAID